MVAPPGAGKGTQGVVIASHFGVPHIATGDLLRDHVERGTELGNDVRGYLDRGELVPDDIVLQMVREQLESLDGDGWVLDGVPRTLPQARALFDLTGEVDMTADVALHLKVSDDELVRRLLARAAESGRSDDTEDVVRHRLQLYYEVTHPILDWYEERGILVSVDAQRPAHLVGRHILTALEVVNQMLRSAPDMPRRAIDLSALSESLEALQQGT